MQASVLRLRLRHGAVTAGVFGALLAIGCAGQDAPRERAWPGSVSQEGDVRVVHNPVTGVLDSALLQLHETWRFDPAMQGPDSLVWARPSQIEAVGDAIYVVDTPESRVYVLSASGDWIRTLGSRGGGPGEFLRPIRVIQLGTRIEVIDGGKATAETFNVNGEHEGSVHLGMMAFNAVPLDSASFAVYGMIDNSGGWRAFDLQGKQHPLSFAVPAAGAGPLRCQRTTPGRASVLTLSCVTPQLSFYDSDGHLRQRIDIARDSIMATSEQLDRFAANARRQMGSSGVTAPMIQQVLDEQLAATRVKQLYRKALQDQRSGLIAIWEQEPVDLGDGPATVHWLSADGLYLGTSHFATGWVDVALANGQLVALVPDAATGEARVVAYTLRDADAHARRMVPTAPPGP